MLSRMLLHLLKTFFPPDLPMYALSSLQRFFDRMIDDPVLLVNIRNPNLIKPAIICILSAAFREKGSLIKDCPISAGALLTLQNRCVKFPAVTVLIE